MAGRWRLWLNPIFWSVVVIIGEPACMLGAKLSCPRMQISDAVEVEGETIKISDLLPPDSPREMKDHCGRFILGESPLPSSQRSFSRAQIERQLRGCPALLGQLVIPDHVIVTRKRRRLLRSEILKAISAAMASEREQSVVIPDIADVPLHAPVFVTKADPGLEVQALEYDPVERKARFLLWASKEPQLLPFYVVAKGIAGPTGITDDRDLSTDKLVRTKFNRHSPSAKKRLSAPPLVAAGKPAKLIVQTPVMRMTTQVTPLESGAQGQVIRVRNPGTRRVLRAEVIGPGLLQVGGEGGEGGITR